MNNPAALTSGPYETGQEATRATRGIYDGPGGITEANHATLLDTCKAAGVYLGAYDHRIVRWLAGFEPETVAVVAGLITRARESSKEALTEAYALGAKGAQTVHTPDVDSMTRDEKLDEAERVLSEAVRLVERLQQFIAQIRETKD